MKQYFYMVLAVLFLLSCRETPDPSSQNNLKQITPLSKDKALERGSANDFAAQAAIGSMMETESSAHMIKLTENPDIQNLATIMVRDHSTAQHELKEIAKAEKISLPQDLPQAQKNILAKLDSLKEDERNFYYARLMVSEHEKAIKLFSQASSTAHNKKLIQFAADKLPVLKHHLAEANQVYKIMQKIIGDKGDYSIKIEQSQSKAKP